jgi:hypothetical protein
MRRLLSRISFWLWGLLAFNAVLIVFSAELPVTEQTLPLALALVLWFFLSQVVIPVVLVIIYRRYLTGWGIWLVLISLFMLTAFAMQGGADMLGSTLVALSSLMLVSSSMALVTAVVILMFRYDLGLRIAAWATVISIWAAVFVWVAQGNVIEAMLQSFEQPGAGTAASIWWLSLLFAGMNCLVPLALLSFLWHTLLLLKREIKGEFPAKPE